MTAVPYGETVGSQVYPGSQSGLKCLHAMVEHTEQVLACWRAGVLALTPAQRAHTIWRLDGGFGADTAINWLLRRRYAGVVKGYRG